MAAQPKKKISKVRSKTRRGGNTSASLPNLVKSTKFPGLMVPHRFRRFFDSLSETDRRLGRAQGITIKNTGKKTKSATPKLTGSRKQDRVSAIKQADTKKLHTRTKKADS